MGIPFTDKKVAKDHGKLVFGLFIN